MRHVMKLQSTPFCLGRHRGHPPSLSLFSKHPLAFQRVEPDSFRFVSHTRNCTERMTLSSRRFFCTQKQNTDVPPRTPCTDVGSILSGSIFGSRAINQKVFLVERNNYSYADQLCISTKASASDRDRSPLARLQCSPRTGTHKNVQKGPSHTFYTRNVVHLDTHCSHTRRCTRMI